MSFKFRQKMETHCGPAVYSGSNCAAHVTFVDISICLNQTQHIGTGTRHALST